MNRTKLVQSLIVVFLLASLALIASSAKAATKTFGPRYIVPQNSMVMVQNHYSVETGGGEVHKGGYCFALKGALLEKLNSNKNTLVRYLIDDNLVTGSHTEGGVKYYPCPSGTLFKLSKTTLLSFKKYTGEPKAKKPKELKILED